MFLHGLCSYPHFERRAVCFVLQHVIPERHHIPCTFLVKNVSIHNVSFISSFPFVMKALLQDAELESQDSSKFFHPLCLSLLLHASLWILLIYIRFGGSNPAEVDGFFHDVKILSTSPSGGTLSWWSRVWDFSLVKESQAWKNRPLNKI